MVVGFTTAYVISAYLHLSCEFESRSWPGVLDTTLCDKVCQWLATGLWFSPGTQISSTNKTDRHDITEILLKVASSTITLAYKVEGDGQIQWLPCISLIWKYDPEVNYIACMKICIWFIIIIYFLNVAYWSISGSG